MPSDHARLSASGSHRWMACPPSLLLEEQFPESTSSYAEEGRLAHAEAEAVLLGELEAPIEYEVGKYIDYVLDRKRETKGHLEIEARLDLSAYVPDGFGTGDAVIFHGNTKLEVIDLKYGQGVPVNADHNTQLMLYGLGAYWTYSEIFDVREVTTTIVQPRLNSISSYTYTVEELLDWATKTVSPLAQQALAGEGRFNPGEHCRFCRAKGICKARKELADQELATLPHGITDARLLTPVEIAKVLDQADAIISWLKDAQDYARESAEAGAKIPGYKLVEGRSNRKYTDEIAVAEAMRAKGWPDEVLFEKKLLGLTAMEKLVGKKTITELPEGLVVKPQGKPVLVPQSDKRDELNSALSDFAHID